MSTKDNNIESVFDELTAMIHDRIENADQAVSYTAKLKAKGLAHVTKKLGEEAVETVIAALAESDDELRNEIADFLFHLLVLMNMKNIKMHEITDILKSRMSQSGIEEKANRTR